MKQYKHGKIRFFAKNEKNEPLIKSGNSDRLLTKREYAKLYVVILILSKICDKYCVVIANSFGNLAFADYVVRHFSNGLGGVKLRYESLITDIFDMFKEKPYRYEIEDEDIKGVLQKIDTLAENIANFMVANAIHKV